MLTHTVNSVIHDNESKCNLHLCGFNDGCGHVKENCTIRPQKANQSFNPLTPKSNL